MLQTHYKDHLSEFFYSVNKPENTEDLTPVLENQSLKEDLNIDIPLVDLIHQDNNAISQAYAGQQFGYFSILGDGRAHLLGEIPLDGQLYDISLKGSGKTRYSRGGDGKSAIGPMLREYLISEALYALDVPTSRSLGVYTTGEKVVRRGLFSGGLLIRVMKSHIRVGTFQLAYHVGGPERLKELLDYTIERLYPGLSTFEFLAAVIDRQARLIAKWMSIGFIHGVMNTDNMSISGEGFDYGPCAFIDRFNTKTVYSSIDREGRYAYGQQIPIGKWNLTQFAETLLDQLEEEGIEQDQVQNLINGYDEKYRSYYREEMGKRLGIKDLTEEDDDFLYSLLAMLQKEQKDYHNFFIELEEGRVEEEIFQTWIKEWEKRKNTDMVVPQIVPRNHLVEEAIYDGERGAMAKFNKLLAMVQSPYEKVDEKFQQAMPSQMELAYQTYCGT